MKASDNILDEIDRRRVALGWTLHRLEREAGVTNMSAVLHGRRAIPRDSTITAILKALIRGEGSDQGRAVKMRESGHSPGVIFRLTGIDLGNGESIVHYERVVL